MAKNLNLENKKEGKLEFLKREDIETMQKDIAKLKEREAQKERERIVSLEPKEEIKIKEKNEKIIKEKEIIEGRREEMEGKTEEEIEEDGEKERKEREEEEGIERKKLEEIKEGEDEKKIAEEIEKRWEEEAARKEEEKKKEISEKEAEKQKAIQREAEINKEIEGVFLKKQSISQERNQFLAESKKFEIQLEPVLNEEKIIEKRMTDIEDAEKKTPLKEKSRIEKKRWEIGAERREIEKRKWLIQEEIEKIKEKIKNVDLKENDALKEEKELKKERERILQKRLEEKLTQEKSSLEAAVSQLAEKRKIIKKEEDGLLIKINEIEAELEKNLNEERITEEVIQAIEAREKSASLSSEQRKIEEERWEVEEDRKKLERKKWELEQRKKDLSAKLKKTEKEREEILNKENPLRDKIKEINRLLKITPEEEIREEETELEEPAVETEENEKEREEEEEAEKKTIKDLEKRKEEEKKEESEEKTIKERTPAIEKRAEIKTKAETEREAEAEEEKKRKWTERIIEQSLGIKKEGVAAPSAVQEEISAPPKKPLQTLIPKPPKRPAPFQRILVRAAAIGIFIFLIGFFYWLLAVKKSELPEEETVQPEKEIEQSGEEKIPPEEEAAEKPEIVIPFSLISANATETAEIKESTDIPQSLKQLLEKDFETEGEGYIRILFKNINENKIAGLKEFFDAFKINAPTGFLEKLNDDFTLFIYSNKKTKRLGFIAEIKEKEGFSDLMLSWEATIEKDTEKLFETLGKEKPAVSPYFKGAIYKNASFRFISFPSENFGICWAVFGDKLIFTSSGESMLKTIDKLKK